jgi:o-succinylbenzoate synthase
MRLEVTQVLSGGGVLRSTVRNAAARWSRRDGILVLLRDEAGRLGCGEASPLPDYSHDDLATCRTALGALCGRPFQVDESAPVTEQLAACARHVRSSSSAARFALEAAALDLIGKRQDRAAHALLQSHRSARAAGGAPLPVTALVPATDPPHALQQARAAAARGVRSIKVKIGQPGGRDRELALLRTIRRQLGTEIRLRLDANAAIADTDVLSYLGALRELEPEFVEEPTADLRRLAKAPLPLALDETLISPDAKHRLDALVRLAPICAIVLKPMSHGGIARCLTLAAQARRLGLSVIVSHLLDGPVALAACAALALCINSPDTACGLDRHLGLTAWPPVALPCLSASHVLPSPLPGLGVAPPGA